MESGNDTSLAPGALSRFVRLFPIPSLTCQQPNLLSYTHHSNLTSVHFLSESDKYPYERTLCSLLATTLPHQPIPLYSLPFPITLLPHSVTYHGPRYAPLTSPLPAAYPMPYPPVATSSCASVGACIYRSRMHAHILFTRCLESSPKFPRNRYQIRFSTRNNILDAQTLNRKEPER